MSRILDRVDYKQYMQSPQWKEKCNERINIDNGECVLCGSMFDLQVHHISYKRFKNENVYEDLITVCPRCHILLHNYYRRVKTAPKEQVELRKMKGELK